MKLYLILFFVLFVSGCSENEIDVPNISANKECPKFNRTINVYVQDLNTTHGAISWEDVTSIEKLISAKNKFNADIDSYNNK